MQLWQLFIPLAVLPLLCCAALQDAVRSEFREVAKLLSDNGGRIYEDGGLVRVWLAGVAGAAKWRPSCPGCHSAAACLQPAPLVPPTLSQVELRYSKLAGVFGYVPQQMFDFDPEW